MVKAGAGAVKTRAATTQARVWSIVTAASGRPAHWRRGVAGWEGGVEGVIALLPFPMRVREKEIAL